MAKHTLNISESSTENIRRRDFFRTATSTYIFHGTFLELTEGLFKQLLNKSPTILNQNQFFFSIRVFFHGHWQLTGQQGKGRNHLIPLYHFHPLTNIQTFYLQLCTKINQNNRSFLLSLQRFTSFRSTFGYVMLMMQNRNIFKLPHYSMIKQ